MKKNLLKGNMKEMSMLIALVIIIVLFSILTNGILLRPMNIANLINQNAYVVILACGMLLCILTGGNIDLSVGSTVALVGACAGTFIITWHWNSYLSIFLCLLIGLLHESKLEDKAEDVIQSIRQTSKGMKNMTAASWRQLYQAVDELHPKFRDQLSAQFGKLNDQQLKVCYLMKIGLSNLQIRNMTNLSRVTVWRWVKKYNWILFPPES